MWSRRKADVGKKGLVVDCKARQVENGLKAQRGDFVRVNALELFGELEAGTAGSKDFARSHNPSKKSL